MAIIESELSAELNDEIKPIVMRVIHATADFSFAESLTFTDNAVPQIRRILRAHPTIITDTRMVAAGINKRAALALGAQVVCFIDDAEVAEMAKSRGVTRSLVSMEKALRIQGPKLFVCGNAPTFLLRLTSHIQEKHMANVAAIGVPVGFVNVVEAKESLLGAGVPAIVSRGRRGGSTVAAAIVNALMYGIEGTR